MSRIARLEAWPFNVPLEAPYEMAPGWVAGINRTVVRVTPRTVSWGSECAFP